MDIIQAFLDLRDRQPRAALYQLVNVNSSFTNYTDGLKNCYLVSNAFDCEDSFYGRNLAYNRDCVDCDYCYSCELCNECLNCTRCYNGNFLQDCEGAIDCSFGYDLKGCRDCFGCVSLRQKEFYIFNEPRSKELYLAEVRAMHKSGPAAVLEKFNALKLAVPRKSANIRQSEAALGDYITNSKNCFYCFDANDSHDCAYCYEIKKVTDSLDISIGEFTQGSYECQSAWKLTNCRFCNNCWESSDLEYCDQVFRSAHCFFCAYLNHKEYCILNKPYPREEYFKKTAEYREKLKAAGLYGRFLIPSAYPFGDSCAAMERM